MHNVRSNWQRGIGSALLLFCVAASATVALADDAPIAPASVATGTPVRFHLVERLASDQSKTGQTFAFVLLDPISVDARVLAAAGAVGTGTLLLAGHNGTSGHEGDLTLRLDAVPTVDGRSVIFDDQQLHINGQNTRAVAQVLGFVPFLGTGARFIRGNEIRLEPTLPIRTVLLRPAAVRAVASPAPSTAP